MRPTKKCIFLWQNYMWRKILNIDNIFQDTYTCPDGWHISDIGDEVFLKKIQSNQINQNGKPENTLKHPVCKPLESQTSMFSSGWASGQGLLFGIPAIHLIWKVECILLSGVDERVTKADAAIICEFHGGWLVDMDEGRGGEEDMHLNWWWVLSFIIDDAGPQKNNLIKSFIGEADPGSPGFPGNQWVPSVFILF